MTGVQTCALPIWAVAAVAAVLLSMMTYIGCMTALRWNNARAGSGDGAVGW